MNRALTAALAAVGAIVIVVVGVSLEGDDEDRGGDEPAATESEPSPETPASETPTGQEQPSQTPTASQTPEEQDRSTTYVGRVDGGAATLAVVVEGSEATAYFCDGVAVESWLGGSATAGRLKLSGDNGSLDADVEARRTIGSVRVEGLRFGFTLREVEPPQGLYRVAETISGAEVNGGWIVLPSGRQVGLVTVDGRSRPAPSLDPATGEVRVDGQVLTAEMQG
jgi:hypothetical protein